MASILKLKPIIGLSVVALGLAACATTTPPDPSPARLAENASCRDLADGIMIRPKRVCATNAAWADYDNL